MVLWQCFVNGCATFVAESVCSRVRLDILTFALEIRNPPKFKEKKKNTGTSVVRRSGDRSSIDRNLPVWIDLDKINECPGQK